ncbi:serine/threonine-protein kinase [Streptomyces sp. WAC 01325]|uniref:serine/threonine-protein kinase n=1 Tax=Streptomyces sp. WAC 01325 TaxID=2203202 RepID=UPI0021B04E44|nr:serine/threonine-protein kinase [Streptomyces sp. WAC 01325]
MGVVYLGRDDDGTLAAVKVIRGESADDPDFRARFAREAELARRVTSPWVVPVLGADAEAAEPWRATAFVPGPSLVEAVAEHGPLPVATARSLGRLLADVLADLHAAGLVHRDVKPANILLAADGPRLIDFGIARAVGVTALTADGSVIGSPGYLSPEQARGRTVGPASDVFSLGCVLAHAATGRPVFGVGGAAGVLYRTVHEEPDLDSVPDALDGIVRRCLAKDPEQRPSVGELRKRFGEFDEQGWLPEGLPALVAGSRGAGAGAAGAAGHGRRRGAGGRVGGRRDAGRRGVGGGTDFPAPGAGRRRGGAGRERGGCGQLVALGLLDLVRRDRDRAVAAAGDRSSRRPVGRRVHGP